MSIDTTGFQARTLDKVERLFNVLEELGRHPALKGKLCMHDGTAINMLMLDVPRLSVDIDMSYIGAVGRDQMLADAQGRGLPNAAIAHRVRRGVYQRVHIAS
jgi:hypothetical protein